MMRGRFLLTSPALRRTISTQSNRTLYGATVVCLPRGGVTPKFAVSGNPARPLIFRTRLYSSSSSPKLSSTERIKIVLREYGTVAVVFHTVMSLASLGTCYLIVDSGVDVGKILDYFNVQSSSTTKGASTFAVAYVLHKMFLPVRAGITVASVPLIVRWMRNRGWIKGVTKVQPK